ncbi:MAG: hypothetical protein HYZ27_02745 [Deltaproteobacteria bacterium]|nr:hypothetical protein [Deltaproteobacteria bacterium]
MELRPPPQPSAPRPRLWPLVALQAALLAALVPLYVMVRPAPAPSNEARDVAGKLLAAGAADEAAQLYEAYLAQVHGPERAKIAFSLGNLYLDLGRYERALRWFYQAELWDQGQLKDEIARKIVHGLDRLGRVHAAQAALAERVRLNAPAAPANYDPVVAHIGKDEIRRSQVLALLDDLPPALRREMEGEGKREELLKRYVADALIYRKAEKLEYDKDPEVRRRFETALRQLIVSAFVEREIVGKLKIDAQDLESYFAAHRDSYKDKNGKAQSFDQARALVERDYRQMKLEDAYRNMVSEELAAADVQLFPERMK